MIYKLDTTGNLQDHYAARLYELDYTPHGKQYKKRCRLTMLWYCPCFWLMGFLLWVIDYLPSSDLIYVAVVPLLAVGIWLLLSKSIFRRRLLREARREEKLFGFGPSTTFFYEDGFSDVTEDVKYDVEYCNVRKAVLYKNSCFFLYTKKLFFMIPCRSLIGQATVQEFAEFLKSRGLQVEYVE